MSPSRRSVPLHYVQGLAMGCADLVPGVSGGTVALIAGIYERLVASIRSAAGVPFAAVRGGFSGGVARVREIELSLVVPLAAGIVSAIAIGAAFIPLVIEAYPEYTSALFAGLIAGSLPVPWRRIERHRAGELAVTAAAAVVAFLLVGLPPAEVTDPHLAYVLLAGAVAICAMILPGVSGAFLLVALGLYRPTLEALRQLDVVYVAVFAAGAAGGLGAFAHLLTRLLRRYHALTMAGLVGLMVGAMRALWPWLSEDRELYRPPADISTPIAAGLFVAGLVAVLLVTRGGRTTQPASTSATDESRPAV